MGKTSPSFSRPDLVAEVTNWIRERIFSGVYPEGGSLPAEGVIATELGVSRNVMREAMRNLRTQGLIEISQGRRPKVTPVNADAAEAAIGTLDALLRRSGASLEDLMSVRVPLETEIAAIAAKKTNNVHIEALSATIAALKKATTNKQRIAADLAFHRYLAEMTGNPVFVLILDTIRGLLRQAHAMTFPKAGITTALNGHTAILNAIRGGHSGAARTAMQEHLDASTRELL